MADVKIRTALVSVSDKSGLTSLGKALSAHNVHILSTGGTFKALKDGGFEAQEVSSYTGFPEMMDGRVKTLHPKVHGGLLGRLSADGEGLDADVMRQHDIRAIDLVVVNLYPFEKTIAAPDVTTEDAIENIDIGGPAMLRSAAKNFDRVAVVVDPADYTSLIQDIDANDGCLTLQTRFELAVKAFRHVADYDVAIAQYLGRIDSTTL